MEDYKLRDLRASHTAWAGPTAQKKRKKILPQADRALYRGIERIGITREA